MRPAMSRFGPIESPLVFYTVEEVPSHADAYKALPQLRDPIVGREEHSRVQRVSRRSHPRLEASEDRLILIAVSEPVDVLHEVRLRSSFRDDTNVLVEQR